MIGDSILSEGQSDSQIAGSRPAHGEVVNLRRARVRQIEGAKIYW